MDTRYKVGDIVTLMHTDDVVGKLEIVKVDNTRTMNYRVSWLDANSKRRMLYYLQIKQVHEMADKYRMFTEIKALINEGI